VFQFLLLLLLLVLVFLLVVVLLLLVVLLLVLVLVVVGHGKMYPSTIEAGFVLAYRAREGCSIFVAGQIVSTVGWSDRSV